MPLAMCLKTSDDLDRSQAIPNTGGAMQKKTIDLIIHIVGTNHSPNLDVHRTSWKLSIGPKDLKIKRDILSNLLLYRTKVTSNMAPMFAFT